MFLCRKGGVESKWPRERVVTARVTVHGGMIQNRTYLIQFFFCIDWTMTT